MSPGYQAPQEAHSTARNPGPAQAPGTAVPSSQGEHKGASFPMCSCVHPKWGLCAAHKAQLLSTSIPPSLAMVFCLTS